MTIQDYIAKMKIVEENLLKFLDYEDNAEENYENIYAILFEQNFRNDPYKLKVFLYLLYNLSKHHHRSPHFFNKIERLIKEFKTEIQRYYSNWTLFKIFYKSKRLLLFLIEEEIIIIDKKVYENMMSNNKDNHIQFLSPEIEKFIEKEFDVKEQKREKKKINFDFRSIENFNEKRHNDFNDNCIYKIIQQDLIEDFIIYINKNDYGLNNCINISIFETNSSLAKRKVIDLIETAAFFGSVQIFKYLYKNEVELTATLWMFAVHGDNPEIINILEEKKAILNNSDEKISFEDCFLESIKCHHNDFANYIHDNYLVNQQENYLKNKYFMVYYRCFQYYNYLFFEDINNSIDVLLMACIYDNYELVKIYLNTHKVDLSQMMISTFIYFYYILKLIDFK